VSQHVIVTSDTSIDLKPLLESAIRDEVRLLDLSLSRTAERLQVFEAQYGMTSEAFWQRFEVAELDERLDYIEWAGEIKTYHLLQTQQQALQNAHVQ
jgi:hypothetical protein